MTQSVLQVEAWLPKLSVSGGCQGAGHADIVPESESETRAGQVVAAQWRLTTYRHLPMG
jgi:hypothetical protein